MIFMFGKHKWRHALKLILLILIVFLLAFYILKIAKHYPAPVNLEPRPDFFGITFSTKYARELELDWQETYLALLDKLQIKHVRIPIYWDEIEAEEGVYDFSAYDYLITEGEKRGVSFVLALGRRVPRWPECHSPSWLNLKNELGVKVSTLKMLKTVVERYRVYDSVEYWQVENEAFLGSFGVCPSLDEGFFKQEVGLVRSLDSRPVIVTASGEMSWWRKEAQVGDILGTTLYRVVYNSYLGYVKYPFPLYFYRLKAKLAGLDRDQIMLMELQAEPWVPQGKMIYLNKAQIDRSLSTHQLRANLHYALHLDWQRAYIWGAEWWYWQKKYGDPEYWWIAEQIFGRRSFEPTD